MNKLKIFSVSDGYFYRDCEECDMKRIIIITPCSQNEINAALKPYIIENYKLFFSINNSYYSHESYQLLADTLSKEIDCIVLDEDCAYKDPFFKGRLADREESISLDLETILGTDYRELIDKWSDEVKKEKEIKRQQEEELKKIKEEQKKREKEEKEYKKFLKLKEKYFTLESKVKIKE